jgi:glutamine cyclotransferase
LMLLGILVFAASCASPVPSVIPTETPSPVPPTATITPTHTPSPIPPTATTLPTSTDTAGPQVTTTPAVASIPTYGYRVVNVYPHDRSAFTQGLVYLDDIFYESTGLRGESSLRKVDPESGEILQYLALPPQLFGEGIAVFEDRIVQLTWQSHIGFVYDKKSFELLETFEYPTEGWGLTHDGSRLIMSDGTETLHFLDPETFEEIDQVQVFGAWGPVAMLNELEYIEGEVYANIWLTDRIARIDPVSGQVTGWIGLTGLLGPEGREPGVDVLNGIAYDAETDRLFVTGKLWPKLFEIELIPRAID